MMDIPTQFHYTLSWRARGAQPGSHATRTQGGQADFRGYGSLLDHPDPRRLDIRASLRSVPRQLMVRTYHERGAVPVYALVDMSASMRFAGHGQKHALAAEIAASVAWSAFNSGDAFGLVACDQQLRMDLYAPLSYHRAAAGQVRASLLAAAAGEDASGLPLAIELLGKRRALVFLISDFHWPPTLLQQTLDALASHDVVPVVLWDSAEYQALPSWGWARLRDMESGREGALFLRPSLQKRILAAYSEQRRQLHMSCLRAGARAPFFVQDHYDAQQLSRHLLEQGA